MTAGSSSPGAERTRLAMAGMRAAMQESLSGSRRRGDRLGSLVFLALLLLGLATALLALAAIIIWALVEGWPRLDLRLFTNVPSTVNPEQAGFRNEAGAGRHRPLIQLSGGSASAIRSFPSSPLEIATTMYCRP